VPALQFLAAVVFVARLGINIPTMGITFWQAHHDWRWSIQNYFSAADMHEIKNDLHADYVRTGFIPDWVAAESVKWKREDRVMDDACAAGLGVMVIVPIGNDRRGVPDLVATVKEFFTRYASREEGCAIVAEIGNEDNLTMSPQAYADIFKLLAPQIHAMGIEVIASGTSGLDVRWTHAVSNAIPAWSTFGFHPYDVPPQRMHGDLTAMARAMEGGSLDRIAITEYGSGDAATLFAAILALASQPAVTVYEYRCQPTDDSCRYGLKENPALYAVVQNAFSTVAARRVRTP
jgi:hypothetical protein